MLQVAADEDLRDVPDDHPHWPHEADDEVRDGQLCQEPGDDCVIVDKDVGDGEDRAVDNTESEVAPVIALGQGLRNLLRIDSWTP